MKLSKNLFATVLMGLSTAVLANEATISTMDNVGSSIKVNCTSNSKALKNALERRVRDVEKQRFVITGECHGPLVIERNGVEISGDSRQNTRLRVIQNGIDDAAIVVLSANVKLSNFNITVPGGVSAVKAKANATVYLNEITTDAKSDWNAPRAQFIATDSSSLFLANLKGAEVLVIGASSADFEAGNSALELDVRDTSAAKSSGTGNHFKRVQLSANAYLLADNQARIDALGIWGKSSAEITRQSTVGNLGMGGQTLFAAYAKSTVTGPYGIYGNVVFELNESSAKCWPKLDKPHSLFVGSNATVNGTLYPSWSWIGQAENDSDPVCAK